jgi:hypothetical protein
MASLRPGQARLATRPYLKNKIKRTGAVAQVIEHFLSMPEILGSIPRGERKKGLQK